MAHTASTDAAASVPDDYVERVARSREQAANEQPPIFLFVIAVALAAIGIAIHPPARHNSIEYLPAACMMPALGSIPITEPYDLASIFAVTSVTKFRPLAS